MSKIKVDRISNRAGTGAPEFVNGIKVVGLTSVADVVGGAATFTKLTTTGTLTYEDVTNVDVLGIATYRSGVQFGVAGVGGTITATGNATITGIVTAAGGSFSGSVTATSFAGDGSSLSGIESWNQQDTWLFSP
jgi:hypothetical protein